MEQLAIAVTLMALGAIAFWAGFATGGRRGSQFLAERDEARNDLDRVQGELDAVRNDLEQARGQREQARVKLAASDAHTQQLQETLKQRAEDRQQLEAVFKNVTADAVKEGREQLLDATKRILDERQQLSQSELKGLVKPVSEQLGKLERQVISFDQKREGAYRSLVTEVGSLRDVAVGLRDVIRSPSMRGQWGEQHLRNILEVSGLLDYADFNEQNTFEAAGRRLRPDVVVNVPHGVRVAIDAKVPLDAYIEACDTDDEQVRKSHLSRHAQTLLGHADTLGKREYSAAIPGSPDFVVMYVPTDPILDAAMEADPTLWDQAVRRHRVLIATPGLMIAFLRTVALAWERQKIQDNAAQIAELGSSLYDSIRIYAGHVDKLGNGLRQAVTAYNKSDGSLESRLLTRASKLKRMGAMTGKDEIRGVREVDTNVRSLVKLKPELEPKPKSELAKGPSSADDTGST